MSIKRVAAFAKRLLQVALQSPGPFAAGTLFLLSEVLKVRLPAAGPALAHVTLQTTTSHTCMQNNCDLFCGLVRTLETAVKASS